MAKVSITNLEGLKERTERKPSPTDRFSLTINREVRDYLVEDLKDRQARLLQALTAPDIKPTKKEKYERLVHGISAALESLIYPNYRSRR